MLQSNRLSKKKSASILKCKPNRQANFFGAAGALTLSLSLLTLSNFSAFADVPINTLPTGYSSEAGNVQFNQNGSTLNISTNANRSIANFDSFSIGQNATVNINLPTTNSMILNRVVGGSASEIMGSLNSNGKVFLINQNGILFGKTANVNVGSLTASTLHISNENFLNNKLLFSQNSSARQVINEGTINAANGGAIVLMGGAVQNMGQISAPNGQVLLGVGKEITLQMADGISANITIDEALDEKVQGFNSAILNSGTINADGGTVKALALLKSACYDKLVNNEGVVKANKINNTNGVIQFVAYTDDGQGTVANSGVLSAMNDTTKDGVIQLIGDKLLLESDNNLSKIEGRDIFLASGDSIGINSIINADNLSLRTGGSIVQSKAIGANNLDILAGGSVNLTNSDNKINRLAANLTQQGSIFDFRTSGSLSVSELNGIKGVYTKDGNVSLQTGDTLNINRNIFAGNGDVWLTADKSNIKQQDGIIVADTLFLRTNGGNASGYTGAGDDNILTSINHLDAQTSAGNAYFGVINTTDKSINIKNANAGSGGTVDIETRGTGNITQSGEPINAATLYLRTAKGNATKDGSSNGAPIEGNYNYVQLDSSQGGNLKTKDANGNDSINFVTPPSDSTSAPSSSTDNSYLNYLEQTITNDLNSGITSGSLNGASSAISDATFRTIVETFKNSAATKSWSEVQSMLTAQGISVAGNIDHTFTTTLANGDSATIKVTGSFKEMYSKMQNEAQQNARQALEQKINNELAQEKKHFDNIQLEKTRADNWNQQSNNQKGSTSRQEAIKEQKDIVNRNNNEYESGERARLAAEQEKLRQEEVRKQQEEWQKWWNGLSEEDKQKYLADQEKIKQEEAAKRLAEDAAYKAAQEQQQKEELEKYYNEYYLNWQAQLDKAAQTAPPAVTTTPTKTTPVNIFTSAPASSISNSTGAPNLFPQTVTRSTSTVVPSAATASVLVNIFNEVPSVATIPITLPAAAPTVVAPLFYKDEPVEVPAKKIIEETPAPVVEQAPIAKPTKEAPSVAKPVFYYPGLW
jgi:filamentous hemagglutinin family protein